VPFVTHQRWEAKRWRATAIDRIDSAPTAVLDCWGVPVRKRWLDGDLGTGAALDNGRRFDIDAHSALYWETLGPEQTHLLPEQLAEVAPILEGGCLKERIVLNRKPPVPRWRILFVVPAGTTLWPQPQMSARDREHGHTWPDCVAGGYAITDPDECLIGHLFRPFAVDAGGQFTWLTLDWNPHDQILTISGPQTWFDGATYPVVIDPTFGYTSIGGGSGGMGGNVPNALGPYAPADGDGTATLVSIYAKSNGSGCLGIYDEVANYPTNRLGDTNHFSVTSAQWNHGTLDAGVPVTNGVNYWLGQHAGTSYDVAFYVGGGKYRKYKSGVTYVSGEIPDPYPAGASTLSNYTYSIYATYGAAAAGDAVQTLSAMTQAAAGQVIVQGDAAQTLSAMTQAAAGQVIVQGDAVQTLSAMTQAAAGQVIVQGDAAQTLSPMTQAAAGQVLVQGDAAQTLPAMTQAAAGVLITLGPYRVAAGHIWHTGAVAGQRSLSGAVAGDVFHAGQAAGQRSLSGAVAGDVFHAGQAAGQVCV